jgi:predicted amidophosphoribosyltransferase
VVIVDDVSTTGATIGEIKKLLLKNGARQVWAVVAAHG